MNWIITPDKYLTLEETKQLRKTCREGAAIAKSRGIQAPVRDALIIMSRDLKTLNTSAYSGY